MTSKQFHLLFVHDDSKSNSGQLEQVITMGGSGKTQDFFLCFMNYQCNQSPYGTPFENTKAKGLFVVQTFHLLKILNN
jgi:hypothetical protein